MNIDNIQVILENYKNTLQDQEDSDDEQETTNQRIQKLVHQTITNGHLLFVMGALIL